MRTGADRRPAELLAALLPCMWGYSELGRELARRATPGEHRYADWIELYASDEFAQLARWCRDALDEIGTQAPAGEVRLREAFLISSYYEVAFWEMAWSEEERLPAASG